MTIAINRAQALKRYLKSMFAAYHADQTQNYEIRQLLNTMHFGDTRVYDSDARWPATLLKDSTTLENFRTAALYAGRQHGFLPNLFESAYHVALQLVEPGSTVTSLSKRLPSPVNPWTEDFIWLAQAAAGAKLSPRTFNDFGLSRTDAMVTTALEAIGNASCDFAGHSNLSFVEYVARHAAAYYWGQHGGEQIDAACLDDAGEEPEIGEGPEPEHSLDAVAAADKYLLLCMAAPTFESYSVPAFPSPFDVKWPAALTSDQIKGYAAFAQNLAQMYGMVRMHHNSASVALNTALGNDDASVSYTEWQSPFFFWSGPVRDYATQLLRGSACQRPELRLEFAVPGVIHEITERIQCVVHAFFKGPDHNGSPVSTVIMDRETAIDVCVDVAYEVFQKLGPEEEPKAVKKAYENELEILMAQASAYCFTNKPGALHHKLVKILDTEVHGTEPVEINREVRQIVSRWLLEYKPWRDYRMAWFQAITKAYNGDFIVQPTPLALGMNEGALQELQDRIVEISWKAGRESWSTARREKKLMKLAKMAVKHLR